MAGISGISNVTASAVIGLDATSRAVDRTAAAVVASSDPIDTVTISPEARALSGSGSSDGDLARNLVDLDTEKNTFAAQVKVVQTADDMSKDLLGIV